MATKPESELQEAVTREPEEVARLAFAYWEERGRPEGSSAEDWFRAEAELRRRRRPQPTLT